MKMSRYLTTLFSLSAFVLLKGDGCGGEVKSVSQITCTDDGRLSLDLAPGECLVLSQACTPMGASSDAYNSKDFELTAQWTNEYWLSLQEDEQGAYMLCVDDEAELGQSVQVQLGVDTKGVFTAMTDSLLVDVNVLGWDFTVETPTLTDHYIEEGMRFTVQSIVLGQSGAVSFGFRSERTSTTPCGHPVVVPESTESPIRFFTVKPEQYWGEAYIPAGIEAGCYRIYGSVTSLGASMGREEYKDFTVRPGLQAVIEADVTDFVIYNSDVSLGSDQSSPSNSSRTWSVMHKATESSPYIEAPHYMEAGGTRFVIEYILSGSYKIALTVADPSQPEVTHTAEMEIHVSH